MSHERNRLSRIERAAADDELTNLAVLVQEREILLRKAERILRLELFAKNNYSDYDDDHLSLFGIEWEKLREFNDVYLAAQTSVFLPKPVHSEMIESDIDAIRSD